MTRGVLSLIVGRGVQALLAIASFRVITDVLPPAQVGGVYLIFSTAYLFTSFLINPVSTYINRKVFLWYDNKNLFAHIGVYNYYVSAIAVLSAPVVWLAWKYFGIGVGVSGVVFSLEVCCYIYVITWSLTFAPILNVLGHQTAFVVLTVSASALGLLLSPLLAHFGRPTAEYWMAGQILALGVVSAISVKIFLAKVREPSPSRSLLKYLNKSSLTGVWLFALPISVSMFFMWAQGQSYRIIVEKVAGAEFLGYLGVGFSISASVAGILESLVQQLYLPEFYRNITNGDKLSRNVALSELAAKAIPIYITYVLFVVGVSEFMACFFVSEKYRSVFVYARYGAFIEFFRMTTNVLAAGAYSEMRTQALVKPYLLGSIASVLGVCLAANSSRPDLLIPLVLVLSGALTAFTMFRAIAAMVKLQFDLRPSRSAVLASLLFLPLIGINSTNLWISFGVLAAAGAYYLLILYMLARRWISRPGGFVKSQTLTNPTENLPVAGQ